MSPKVSVIMGIYNCAATLSEAIDSILAQTYTDWELIMCDDGSTDNTFETAKEYCSGLPERIILLRNEKNMGLNYTLNRCLEKARGEYIARMDGDDVSLPERFETELAVLENQQDIAIVSTAMTYFDESGDWGQCRVIEQPKASDFIAGTPFCHAPCMVRKTAYDLVGGYTEDSRFLRVEDYDLWVKMYAAGLRGRNLTQPLYKMRDDRDAFSRRKFKYRINEVRVKAKAIRLLHLSKMNYFTVFRPIAVGLLPRWLYTKLHQMRFRSVAE